MAVGRPGLSFAHSTSDAGKDRRSCTTPQHVWALRSIYKGKSKVLKVNTVTDTPIMLEGEALGEMESFTYLGSILDNTGETEADVHVRARIGKARAAFQQLTNVWRTSLLGTSSKIRVFNTIMKLVLIFAAET